MSKDWYLPYGCHHDHDEELQAYLRRNPVLTAVQEDIAADRALERILDDIVKACLPVAPVQSNVLPFRKMAR